MHFCDFLLHCLDRPCQIKMVPPHIAITHSRIFALDGVRWKSCQIKTMSSKKRLDACHATAKIGGVEGGTGGGGFEHKTL